MKDGPIRTIVKRIALVCFTIDLSATRFLWRLQGKSVYRLGGACEKCAQCCESPVVQTNPIYFRSRVIRRLMLAWHKRVNGFELTSELPRQNAFVFKCTHFDTKTRRCDSYHSRPGMCRDYPRALLFDASPEFLPKCGYFPVAPNAAKLADLLDQEDIDPAKREELKKKLHVKE
ncbi:YkgJ family cysteine cluster protein [bacterium]|nr:YkgJ family cysteine cluster protein [bacterium]